MPDPTPVPVAVTYETSTTFTYVPPKPDVATIGPGSSLITFTLTDAHAANVIWDDPWLTWNDQAPPEFTFEQPGTLEINNTLVAGSSPETYAFTLHVIHPLDGNVANSDPDIVLDPPGT